MEHLIELLGKLEVPPEQMARIAETARTNPLAAVGMLNEYLTPEMLQELLAAFLANPDALGQVAEQAGLSPEDLASLQAQFGEEEAP